MIQFDKQLTGYDLNMDILWMAYGLGKGDWVSTSRKHLLTMHSTDLSVVEFWLNEFPLTDVVEYRIAGMQVRMSYPQRVQPNSIARLVHKELRLDQSE